MRSPLLALHRRRRRLLLLLVSIAVLVAAGAAATRWQRGLLADWASLALPIRLTSLEAAARHFAGNGRRSDIVVSLTTLPGRESLLSQTLKSLLLQTLSPAEITIHVAPSARFPVPAELRHLECFSSSIKVIRHEQDLGPSMKAIPAILAAAATPDQRIVYLDDDTLYPRDLLAHFDTWSAALPDAALAGRGWQVAPSLKWTNSPALCVSTRTRQPAPAPLPVDIVAGYGAVLVKPRFFDAARLVAYAAAPPEAFFVDDIWLSGCLAAAGVQRFLIPMRRNATAQLLRHVTASLSAGANADGRNNSVVLEHFSAHWRRAPPRPQK